MRRILLIAALAITMIVPSGVQAQTIPDLSAGLADHVSGFVPADRQQTQPQALHLPEVADAPVDPRVEAIEALLARYHAPIQGLGREFVEVADRDGYDWRLLVSISGIESSFGLHQLGHNLFGWGGGRMAFASFADAIDTVSRGLASGYIRRGLTTPQQIQPVYCPPNPAWAAHVSSFMAQLATR